MGFEVRKTRQLPKPIMSFPLRVHNTIFRLHYCVSVLNSRDSGIAFLICFPTWHTAVNIYWLWSAPSKEEELHVVVAAAQSQRIWQKTIYHDFLSTRGKLYYWQGYLQPQHVFTLIGLMHNSTWKSYRNIMYNMHNLYTAYGWQVHSLTLLTPVFKKKVFVFSLVPTTHLYD